MRRRIRGRGTVTVSGRPANIVRNRFWPTFSIYARRVRRTVRIDVGQRVRIRRHGINIVFRTVVAVRLHVNIDRRFTLIIRLDGRRIGLGHTGGRQAAD